MMKNPYYILWADAISRFKKLYPEIKNWKLEIFCLLTVVQSINLWIVAIWLKYLNIYKIPELDIHLFPGQMLNSASSFAIIFSLPLVLVNYLLIFHKDRYKKILNTYKASNTNYSYIYAVTVLLIALLSAFLSEIY